MNTGKRMLPEPRVRVSGSQGPSLPLPELGGPMQNHSVSKVSVASTANEDFRWNNKHAPAQLCKRQSRVSEVEGRRDKGSRRHRGTRTHQGTRNQLRDVVKKVKVKSLSQDTPSWGMS